MNRLLVVLLGSLALFINVHGAYGMCGYVKYTVSGRIVYAGGPVDGATVYVFLDNNEGVSLQATSGNKNGRYANSQDFTVSDLKGGFVTTLYFDSFNRQVGVTDICDRVPTRIEVFVIRTGYLAKRKIFSKGQFEIQETHGGLKMIEFPAIQMQKDIPLPDR